MIFCGVDYGLTDTKYAYQKNGDIICTNTKPDFEASYGYTGIKAADKEHHFPEFDCVVAGAKRLTGLKEFLLVSTGTGTAFLRVTSDNYSHLGGSGLGGGTIKGLYGFSGKNADVRLISALSERGNVNNVDLIMSDIMDVSPESLLPPDITVSLLHKLNDKTLPEDFAAGITHLVAESLLMMAVFARRNSEKIVFTGGLANLKILRQKASILERIHKISFIFPENASFAGAIGCLINVKSNIENNLKENNYDLS
ncbi:MAG: hypothetical protein LBL80_01735 [Ruminococcus sp.]|jgi:type II pantothenate kinase|nr:hypothetical protein [Ruminococcus sp.]